MSAVSRLLVLLVPSLLGLGACRSDYSIQKGEFEAGVDLELVVTSPTYGAFLGDAPVLVTGTVSPVQAVLMVEGEEVEVSSDGSFAVEVPFERAYRIIEVEASLDEQREDFRVPVFRGTDPALLWPGAMTGRILPSGFEYLGASLGAVIDGLGWEAQIEAILPAYDSDLFDIRPVGVTHDPSVVFLTPQDGGIGVAATLVNTKIEYEVVVDALGFSTELSMSFGEIAIGAVLEPVLDEDGMISLLLDSPTLRLDTPDFVVLGLDGRILEWVVDAAMSYLVEPLADLLLGVLVDTLGVIELGGPFAFDTDLLGTQLSILLADLYVEESGLALELGVGIDEPASPGGGILVVPTADSSGVAADAQVALAVHEGLLQVAIGDLLVDLLGQVDALLGGFGDILGAMVTGLPGGDQAPEAAEGWCLSLDPGTAWVARMNPGIAPLGAVYMPDLIVDIGTRNGAECDTWLKASLAAEINLNIEDGTALGIDLVVPEGALLEYGAVDQDPDEVVAALGAWLQSTFGLVGGFLNLDLADILGGLGGGTVDPADPLSVLTAGLAPEVLDSQPLLNEDGTWDEGLYVVSLGLWE